MESFKFPTLARYSRTGRPVKILQYSPDHEAVAFLLDGAQLVFDGSPTDQFILSSVERGQILNPQRLHSREARVILENFEVEQSGRHYIVV